MFRSVGSDDKEPGAQRGCEAGPGGLGGAARDGIGRLTSPSHLFFPLRQAVQARAPLLGMCIAVGVRPAEVSWGDWAIAPFAVEMERLVLRRLAGTSELLDTDVAGDKDMEEHGGAVEGEEGGTGQWEL